MSTAETPGAGTSFHAGRMDAVRKAMRTGRGFQAAVIAEQRARWLGEDETRRIEAAEAEARAAKRRSKR